MTLHQALIGKGYDSAEATEIIESMYNQMIEENADPEELLYEEGLEPDYVVDLIWHKGTTI